MAQRTRRPQQRKRKKKQQANPLLRVFGAGALVAVIVMLCIAATGAMPAVDPSAIYGAAPTQEPTPTPIPTPTPVPTITPTPAIYAPFGAQYGHGGADLIPETPTPQPTATMPYLSENSTEASMMQALRGKPVSWAAMYCSAAFNRLARPMEVMLNTSDSSIVRVNCTVRSVLPGSKPT